MENQIRKKREKSNKLKTAQNEMYKGMFEPVTRSINTARFTDSVLIINDEINDEELEERKIEEEKPIIMDTSDVHE